VASNVINLAKAFNQREGLTKREDKLPSRFFKEVLGKSEKTIQPEDLAIMLREYYQLRGWK